MKLSGLQKIPVLLVQSQKLAGRGLGLGEKFALKSVRGEEEGVGGRQCVLEAVL